MGPAHYRTVGLLQRWEIFVILEVMHITVIPAPPSLFTINLQSSQIHNQVLALPVIFPFKKVFSCSLGKSNLPCVSTGLIIIMLGFTFLIYDFEVGVLNNRLHLYD
jgi:hypothetical protein